MIGKILVKVCSMQYANKTKSISSVSCDLALHAHAKKVKPGNKKKSCQDYTVDGSSNRCFKCSKLQLFEPMCFSSHCRGEEWSVFGGWFSWFLGRQLVNKLLSTTQNWLFCVVLMVLLRHVQFTQKNRRSFVSKCFLREQLILKQPYSRLLFTFGLIHVNSRIITCHDVTDNWTTIDFGRPSQNSSWSELWLRLNSPLTRFTIELWVGRLQHEI